VLVVVVLVRELCRPFAKCFCGALEREGKTLSIDARQRQRSQRPSTQQQQQQKKGKEQRKERRRRG